MLRRAFRNANLDRYLGGSYESLLGALVSRKPATNILDGKDLQNEILSVVDEVIIHHVENRQWIEAFWDGRRSIKIDGQKWVVPAKPKVEPEIQPTLDVLFIEALEKEGIRVSRETDEGIGNLDFCFSYTSPQGQILTVNLEVKLAHHRKIRHGITKQLPSYMKANRCTNGIYLVLWFKDEKSKIFSKPKNFTKDETRTFLLNIAKELKSKEGIDVQVRVVDASVRPQYLYHGMVSRRAPDCRIRGAAHRRIESTAPSAPVNWFLLSAKRPWLP